MTFIKENQNERFRFIDIWAEYVKSHSDKEWSTQQNVIINSCLRSASITKEQFFYMKKREMSPYPHRRVSSQRNSPSTNTNKSEAIDKGIKKYEKKIQGP